MRKLVALLVLSCFAPVYVLGSVDFEIVHTHPSGEEHCHFSPAGVRAHSQHDAHDCDHHGHTHSHDDHAGSDESPSEKPESLEGEPVPHHHVISLNLDFAQPVAESFSLQPDSKPEGRIHSERQISPEDPYLEINKPPQQV